MALYLAKKGKNKGQSSVNEQGKVKLCVFYLSSDIRNILTGILGLTRLVPSSCEPAPRIPVKQVFLV